MSQTIQTVKQNVRTAPPGVLAKRVGYVDVAKGIGIILVVMGHNDFSLIAPFAHKLIYSFHMPMFFLMSGMFFKPDAPFWTFFWNRINRVLKPFFTILLLLYFAGLGVMGSHPRRILVASITHQLFLPGVSLAHA